MRQRIIPGFLGRRVTARTVVVLAAILVGVCAIALVALFPVLESQLVYRPDSTSMAPAEVGLPEVTPVRTTTADGLDLTGWYGPPRHGMATLLYLPGNAGNIGGRAERVRPYLDAGYGVFLVGYRGFGGNPGRPSEDGLYRDARAAIAWLAGQGAPPGRLVLYGESLGSGVAVQMATEHPVAALVLEAPYTSFVDVLARRHPLLSLRWLGRQMFENLAKIGGIGAPLLVLHGEADTVVPRRMAERLLAAAPAPKEAAFLPAAGHADLYRHGGVEAVLDFLARHVPPGG